MARDSFETIIIGAGPGGLTAGRYLKDSIILDQKEEIGRPVQCAEGLSRNVLDRQGIKPDSSWISAVIDRTEFIMPNKKAIKLCAKEAGYVLDRVAFEKFLASRCNIEIRLKSRAIDVRKEEGFWKVKTQDGAILTARYIIGADGPFSIVRRNVFTEKVERLFTLQYLVKTEKDIDVSTIKMFFDREKFPFGYAWLFPKSKNTANIGLGGNGNLQKKFEYFMQNVLKEDIGRYELLENKTGVVPWGGALLKLEKEGALLVGDAGGLADPIFGGGMQNAMISGEIAAESINSGNARLYESRIKAMPFFSNDLLSAQKILYSFSNESLNEAAELLEKKDIFLFKHFSFLFKALRRPNLRKHFSSIVRLIFIYKKNIKLWV